MRNTRTTLVGILLAAVAMAVAACGGNGDGAASGVASDAKVDSGPWGAVMNGGGEPVRGGALRVDVAAAPQGISPLFFLETPSNTTIQVLMQVFDQLVTLEPGSLEPKPGLAEKWTVSDDGLTYTFNLRAAKFSDGSPVTSADVKFTLDAARKSAFADLFAAIDKIGTPDDSTVVLELSEPSPALLEYLAFPGASIMPAKLVESMGEEAYNEKPIGSGPFVIESWTKDQEVVLARNPEHWREGRPYLDSVRMVAVPDDNTRVLNVRSGGTDVADAVPFSQIKSINDTGSARVIVGPGADMYVIALNNSHKPLDEVEVRRALNYATPVERIINVVFHGEAPAMNTVMPKLKYWTDAAKAYPYDVEKAKAELAKSSVPDGFAVRVMASGNDQASSQTAQIIKEAWAQIGVDVTIDTPDDATRTERFQSGEYEVSITPPGRFTADVPVDDQFATLLFNSPAINNLFTFYKNPEVGKLTREAVRETDEARRKELFEQIHVASMENPPVVPIAYTPNRAAVRNDVHAFNYLVNGWWRLDSVWKAGDA